MMLRAGARYRQALGSLEGLERMRVQKRLGQLDGSTSEVTPADPVAVGELHCFMGQNLGVFSPDGRAILTSGRDKDLHLWSSATCREIRRFSVHTARARELCFTPAGDRIVSVGDDATIRVWDTETARLVHVHKSQTTPQKLRPSAVVLTGGKRLLWCGNDRQARITDLQTGRDLHVFSIRHGATAVYMVAFSQDGRWGLSGGFESTARLWNVALGQAVNFNAHTHVYGGALSPDGRLGLTGGQDRLVRFWDLARRTALARYTGHSDHVYAMAFSADGRQILSGTQNGEVRLWDAKTTHELHLYRGHTKSIERVCFSPDGRYALSSGQDETVRLLGLPLSGGKASGTSN
jgi:hypothetical protein